MGISSDEREYSGIDSLGGWLCLERGRTGDEEEEEGEIVGETEDEFVTKNGDHVNQEDDDKQKSTGAISSSDNNIDQNNQGDIGGPILKERSLETEGEDARDDDDHSNNNIGDNGPEGQIWESNSNRVEGRSLEDSSYDHDRNIVTEVPGGLEKNSKDTPIDACGDCGTQRIETWEINADDHVCLDNNHTFSGRDFVVNSQSIDLNIEPHESTEKINGTEEVLGSENAQIPRLKEKKQKKTHKSKSAQVSLKLKDVLKGNGHRKQKKYVGLQLSQSNLDHSESSINISEEIDMTKKIGNDVGFQLDGFEEVLRNEIEGEGVFSKKK
ncbi:hypothetical protein L1887_05081 [Cichorium endivia]|nr:hypothetical protein L1887_05081 [Cichorium endivia]